MRGRSSHSTKKIHIQLIWFFFCRFPTGNQISDAGDREREPRF